MSSLVKITSLKPIFYNQTQGCIAENTRIDSESIFSVVLHGDKGQHMGDAMQHEVQHHIVNLP